MASPSKQTYLSRLFSDPKNYPRGFRRSGDFSIKEADALEQYGNLIVALEAGDYVASDDEDQHLLAVLRGQEEAETLATKAWVKYVKCINRPKYGSIYGTKKVCAESDESVDDDSEIDIDDDSLDTATPVLDDAV